jgi:hypothetical protein
MANISSAYGNMSLTGDWKRGQIDTLNKIADKVWRSWGYNIDVSDEFGADTERLSSAFLGNGRWAFELNLEYLGAWTENGVADGYPELLPAYKTLLADMEANGLSIDVSFSDEEGGCEVLYKQEGVLKACDGSLVYEKNFTEQFEYNWRNVIDVAEEGGSFNELVAALAEHAGIPESDAQEIEAWAMENTYPHSFSFDCLDDEQQADFTNRFCRADNKQT